MGIGGAGMCALAEAVVRGGGRVTGCDVAPGEATRPLERMGVRVWGGHRPEHVASAAALVASAAVPSAHPELAAARAAGIPVWKRAEALGDWVSSGKVVAVAGTHGKTTTTAMTTAILAEGGLDPTGFVGGRVQAWGGHLRPGSDGPFVVEADEFDRSFHHLKPTVALVTNVEADHLDVYQDLEGVRAGFLQFLAGVRKGGTVLICADDAGVAALAPSISGAVRTYGFSAGSQLRGSDYRAEGSRSRFRVLEDGVDRGWLTVVLPGRHNATNALGAAAAARTLGVEWGSIRAALAAFAGVGRRFQRLGQVRGITVVDDYAHHPSEISASVAAAREVHPTGRLVVVFQPHLFSRTRDFARDFGAALAQADIVWVTDVYPARELPIPGVDGGLVAREVSAAFARRVPGALRPGAGEVHDHPDLGTLAEAVATSLRSGDLCLTLGAGSIERTGPEIVRRLGGQRTEAVHA
jgi:UDP-N-acetylmuramate--alanine ligase